jgi:Tol biopolymer transport system component
MIASKNRHFGIGTRGGVLPKRNRLVAPLPRALAVAGMLCVAALPGRADTSCLVAGGWISYVSQGAVYTMRPDGWYKKRLTHNGTTAWPAYSMNGCRIVFMSDLGAVAQNPHQGFNRIFIMRTDGTHQTALTGSLQYSSHPRFNLAGTKIVYAKELLFGTSRTYSALFLSNANGSGAQEINDHDVRDPAWSWSGNGLVCTAGTTSNVDDPAFEHPPDVYAMTPVAIGGAMTRLTTNAAYDGEPELNPDSTKIVFVSERDGNKEIYIMNRDSSAQTRLTSNAARDTSPVFSPDGQKIAWVSNRDGDNEIYVMNTDGSGQLKITNNTADDNFPHWR